MDKDRTKKLIENSGILTHKKVIDILRAQGWKLLISPYYYDNIANTVREIDIIAEKQFNSSGVRRTSSVQVNVQLFIECKYLNQEIAFWFDEKDLDSAVVKMERDSGLKILHNRHGADITTEELHYLTEDKVAKIFSTNSNKEDVIYKAITQCLNAQLYYDQWYDHPIHFDFFNHYPEIATQILKYPVIICDNFSNLVQIEFEDERSEQYSFDSIDYPFQIETNYTFLNKDREAKTEYFLTDMLDVYNVTSFLGSLGDEIKSVMGAIDLKRF